MSIRPARANDPASAPPPPHHSGLLDQRFELRLTVERRGRRADGIEVDIGIPRKQLDDVGVVAEPTRIELQGHQVLDRHAAQ